MTDKSFYEATDILKQIEKDISKLKDHEVGEIKIGDLRKLLELAKK